jgi:hypothetical protein
MKSSCNDPAPLYLWQISRRGGPYARYETSLDEAESDRKRSGPASLPDGPRVVHNGDQRAPHRHRNRPVAGDRRKSRAARHGMSHDRAGTWPRRRPTALDRSNEQSGAVRLLALYLFFQRLKSLEPSNTLPTRTAPWIPMPISGAGAPTCDAGPANADPARRVNQRANVKGFIQGLPK